MKSIWQKTTSIPNKKTLTEPTHTDVLIIGGGLTGILCAYQLEKAGIPYILVEANNICSGITQNTTAKITSQHGLIYDKLIRQFGEAKARMYLEANELAITEYRTLCSDIDCDFEETDSYVYSLNNRDKIVTEISALRRIGFKAEYANEIPLPFNIAGAVKFHGQAQFNPLKFVNAISGNLNIYENTRVHAVNRYGIFTNRGTISADKIIVTTHFPFINKHGSYFLKMYQHRSYVIALENAPNVNGMYVDESKNGMSFRNYDNLLLIGGGSHRTGKHGGCWDELSAFAKTHYPDATEVGRWATQDCMTLDGVPYIGQYSMLTPNLYVATGFNKWGMTSSMVASFILRDLVQGKHSKYACVFNPSRSILRPQLAINAFEATTNLLSISTKRCPHLGCALKYNKHEHSWDCPCHGSRFSKDGILLDNPSNKNLHHKI